MSLPLDMTPSRNALSSGAAVLYRALSAVTVAYGLAAFAAPPLAAAPGGNVAVVPISVEPGAVVAPAPAPADTEIKIRLDRGDVLTIGGERLRVGLLRRFYAGHGYQPVWDRQRAAAAALWQTVSQAADQGLDPSNFHAAALADPTALSPIDRDLLLSDAVLAYADALARGAVPNENRIRIEALSPGPVDTVAAVDAAIASPDPAAAINALAPGSPDYVRLKRAYQTYLGIVRAGGWPQVDAARPEDRFRQLQERLALEGYLPAGYATGQFDDMTADALRLFQARHGIEPDGKLGPATIAELNLSAEARAQQLAVNLERWRWLPRTLPAERVWVNTASMHLQFFRDNAPIFTTRVVVGQIDKQTPEFSTTINSLLYNPPWNVPVSIAATEILPKLETDPDYLERHNMVMRENGSVQQLPGAGTALGRLKFEMEDRFDVYLHDTPLRHLFARENRRLSHGCVRVQNPRDLAALLLQEPVDTINHGIALGYTNRRALAAPIPVFIVYQTAFVGADGNLEFRRDAYRRDDDIWHRLMRNAQLPIAGQETGQRRG
jgi:murein L,D-transpeptidase YcbB/YkuD